MFIAPSTLGTTLTIAALAWAPSFMAVAMPAEKYSSPVSSFDIISASVLAFSPSFRTVAMPAEKDSSDGSGVITVTSSDSASAASVTSSMNVSSSPSVVCSVWTVPSVPSLSIVSITTPVSPSWSSDFAAGDMDGCSKHIDNSENARAPQAYTLFACVDMLILLKFRGFRFLGSLFFIVPLRILQPLFSFFLKLYY